VGQAVYPVEIAIRGEYFGRKRFATISGILNAIIAVGAFIGPIYAGWSHDATGTYNTSFTFLAIASAAGAVFFFLARRPAPPKRLTVAAT
jgi:MFS family permease